MSRTPSRSPAPEFVWNERKCVMSPTAYFLSFLLVMTMMLAIGVYIFDPTLKKISPKYVTSWIKTASTRFRIEKKENTAQISSDNVELEPNAPLNNFIPVQDGIYHNDETEESVLGYLWRQVDLIFKLGLLLGLLSFGVIRVIDLKIKR